MCLTKYAHVSIVCLFLCEYIICSLQIRDICLPIFVIFSRIPVKYIWRIWVKPIVIKPTQNYKARLLCIRTLSIYLRCTRKGSSSCLYMPQLLVATKQLYEWFSLSVCLSVRLSVRPSVRPSVCHNFSTMFPSSYYHDNFRSQYHWQKWCPCGRSRSKVKVTEVRTKFRYFRTITAVWIHIW